MRLHVQLSLPRDARFVPLMRNVAARLLTDLRVPDDAAGDVTLAMSEACANVVRHAAGSTDYRVSLVITDGGCEVEVVDVGPGFSGDGQEPAAPEAETGRGLPLMRALVDDLQFLREPDGTRVRLVKQWPDVTLQKVGTAAGP